MAVCSPLNPPSHPQSSERRTASQLRVLCFSDFAVRLTFGSYSLVIILMLSMFVYIKCVCWLFLCRTWLLNTSDIVDCDVIDAYLCLLSVKQCIINQEVVKFFFVFEYVVWLNAYGFCSVTSDCCRGRFPLETFQTCIKQWVMLT